MTTTKLYDIQAGRMRSASNNYATALAGGAAIDQRYYNPDTIVVGQNKESTTPRYRVNESFLFFHTLGFYLPLGARITGVRLKLRVSEVTNNANPPWTVEVYHLAWHSSAENPSGGAMETADWRTPAQLSAMTLLGVASIEEPGLLTITGNQAFIDLVTAMNNGYGDDAGVQFVLATNRTRSQSAPGGEQYLRAYAFSSTASRRPVLEVDWEDPQEDPVITAVEPSSAEAGDLITISGTNFPADADVLFERGEDFWYPDSLVSWSPTAITCYVPAMSAGACTITVTASQGDSNAVAFTVTAAPPAPNITSVSPASAAVGDQVTIFGTNLTPYNDIEVDGVGAVVVLAEAPTAISFTIPSGVSTGVTTIDLDGVFGDDSIAFTVIETPVDETPAISDIDPDSGIVGSEYTLTGVYFKTDAVVKFGATEDPTVVHDSVLYENVLRGHVPNVTAAAYNVTVTTSEGTSAAVSFTVAAQVGPAITSLTPSSGPDGCYVVIAGTRFGVSGRVTIGGVAAQVSDWSTTRIVAVVPVGMTAGSYPVVVTTPAEGGLSSSAAYFEVMTQARSEQSSVVASGASEYVAVLGGNVLRIPPVGENKLAADGWLRSSASSMRVVGPKNLHHFTVFHEPFDAGEIGVRLVIDDTPLDDEFIIAPTSDIASTFDADYALSRLAYILRIASQGLAPKVHALQFYATLAPVQRYQYVLKAIEESGDANDLPIQGEYGPKLEALRALRQSGRVVTVKSRFDGVFPAKIEKVQRGAIKVDEHALSQEQGIVIVQVREMR